MAAPAFRSSSPVAYAARTTLPLTLPSGVAAGDGMLSIATLDGNWSSSVSRPSGWERLMVLYDDAIGIDGATLVIDAALFGVAAPTYSWGGARIGSAGIIGAWRGVAASGWQHGFDRAAGTSRAPSVAGPTTDSADETVLWGTFQLQSPTAEPSALPASFTSRIAHSAESTATVADRAYASPTAAGALAGTLGQSVRWVAWTVALRSIAPTSGATVAHYDGSRWTDQPAHVYDGSWRQAAGIGVL